MKLALIGYGKMGKAIDELVKKRFSKSHEIVLRIDSQDAGNFEDQLKGVDVAIEFTRPNAAVKNITTCLEIGIPIVVGTTGWYNQKKEVFALVEKFGGTLFYASNFSLGVNITFELNRKLAEMMAKQKAYRVDIEEIHHTEKLDAPSGTAMSFAEDILWANPTLENWENDETEKEDVLPIISKRIPNVKGTHEISYRSKVDTITLKHEAHNRDGFSEGALMAAKFVQNKKGIYTMKDLLGI